MLMATLLFPMGCWHFTNSQNIFSVYGEAEIKDVVEHYQHTLQAAELENPEVESVLREWRALKRILYKQ